LSNSNYENKSRNNENQNDQQVLLTLTYNQPFIGKKIEKSILAVWTLTKIHLFLDWAWTFDGLGKSLFDRFVVFNLSIYLLGLKHHLLVI